MNAMNQMFLYHGKEDTALRLTELFSEDGVNLEECEKFQRIHEMVDYASSRGLSGNLYHAILTDYIVNHENEFSMACEMRGDCGGSLSQAASHDFQLFMNLFQMDLSFPSGLSDSDVEMFLAYTPIEEAGYIFNRRIRDCIMDLCEKLEKAQDVSDFKTAVTDFYKAYGVGSFGLHKAFRVSDSGQVVPITRIKHVHLDDLVGYEYQKKQLVDNTRAFLEKKPANNALLCGDAGTGKSTSIKAIVNEYYTDGLRVIEIFKHQFKDLNKVISQIKNRNYRFIIYMDDLSFEEFETDYKYLKAVIEGGLEKKPDNILIYATSNRRHLVRESTGDKKDYDDMHKNDTVQEKLSLSYRFGVKIYYESPSPKEFKDIVLTLRDRASIDMSDEEILQEANKWEISHGGLSGRTAQQFIDYIAGSFS